VTSFEVRDPVAVQHFGKRLADFEIRENQRKAAPVFLPDLRRILLEIRVSGRLRTVGAARVGEVPRVLGEFQRQSRPWGAGYLLWLRVPSRVQLISRPLFGEIRWFAKF
jgi:hypothetical protein